MVCWNLNRFNEINNEDSKSHAVIQKHILKYTMKLVYWEIKHTWRLNSFEKQQFCNPQEWNFHISTSKVFPLPSGTLMILRKLVWISFYYVTLDLK